MKKTILTLMVAIATMIGASAQTFTVVSTYNAPAEGADLELGAITDNLGVLVSVANNCSAGFVKNGEEYDLIGRYNYSDAIYISLQAPTEETTDNLSIGLGYSLSVWKGVCVEPNYTMPVSADDNGDREGSFNLGLSYRF
jgi:hypothetical protein|tara:strand:- start:901 stop:1320 length:420 start_codon:yes stop_codon:yes gene_type:complete